MCRHEKSRKAVTTEDAAAAKSVLDPFATSMKVWKKCKSRIESLESEV